MQECPKDRRVRHGWASKRGNPHKNRFTYGFTGNFTRQCDIRGISIWSLTKISTGSPKTQIKNPSKNESLWFVLYGKLVAFFWNFGLHMNRTLSVSFIVHTCSNHGMCHKIANAMALNKPEMLCMSYREWNQERHWPMNAGPCTFWRYIWLLSSNLQNITRRPLSIVVIFKTIYG